MNFKLAWVKWDSISRWTWIFILNHEKERKQLLKDDDHTNDWVTNRLWIEREMNFDGHQISLLKVEFIKGFIKRMFTERGNRGIIQMIQSCAWSSLRRRRKWWDDDEKIILKWVYHINIRRSSKVTSFRHLNSRHNFMVILPSSGIFWGHQNSSSGCSWGRE